MKTNTGSDAVLCIEDLGKQYPNSDWGIRAASAEFASGRMVAVLGPNGAGKSTLIHLLAGAIAPTEGHVQHRSGVRIGWSSQRTTIDWYLNVRQNVEMGGRVYGLGRQECRARALSLLERFQLVNLAANDVSMLSGGQQQRIQVARALMSDPDILLLDEPTSSLDVEASEAVLGYLRDKTTSGALALISSHDLGLLERYCDEVLFVLDGGIVTHQSMTSFLQRFTPSDSMTLTLESEISPEVLTRLTSYSPAPDHENRHNVSVSFPAGTTLSDIVLALEGVARVVDASRTPASLRNVYLHLAKSKEESR